MKLTIKEIRRELDTFSALLSSSVRFLALSVIGGVWAILTAHNISLSDSVLFISIDKLVSSAFFLAVFALALDLFQYLFGYLVHNRAHDYLEYGNGSNDFEYSDETLGRCYWHLYQIAPGIFRVKLVALIGSAIAFLLLTFGISVNE